MTVDEKFQKICDRWFILEPTLLMCLLTHELVPNSEIKTIRSGRGKIEYNPLYLELLNENGFEEALKAEVIRILLRHPYRQVLGERALAYIASNITLNEFYDFKNLNHKAEDFFKDFKEKQHYEYYQNLLFENADNLSFGDANEMENQNAELWEQDDLMEEKIKHVIEQAESSRQWGSIPGQLKQTLIASLKPEMDYRKILSGFRASILSSQKTLTRFKPSRRYGWDFMGKKNTFTTGILVGVDVSGSITDKELRIFYSAVNRFFKYGIERLDAQQFDYVLQGNPVEMKKAKREIKVKGRGGTNFQPVIDFFEKNRKIYDGLIIFTDGYSDVPKIRKNLARRIAWVASNKGNYDAHHEWMEKLGRCCYIN